MVDFSKHLKRNEAQMAREPEERDDEQGDADDDGSPAVPEGTYTAFAIWQSMVVGGNTEGQALRVSATLRIEDPKEFAGKSVRWFGTSATQKSLDLMIKSMILMGWDGKSPIETPTGFGENSVEIVVEHREWDGKTRAQIKWVNALGGGFRFKAAASTGRLAQFNEQIQRHIRSTAPRDLRQEPRGEPRRAPADAQRFSPPRHTTAPAERVAPPRQSDEDRARAIDRGDEGPASDLIPDF